jgi:flagellar hook-associated protein 3 FlgL
MRITSLMMFNELQKSLQKSLQETARYNLMLASGKKISRPSEDVTGTTKAMDYKLSISSKEQYKTNITDMNLYLKFTDTVLSSFSDSLSKIKGIALSTSAGADTTEQMSVYAVEVSHLRDHLLNLGNSRFRNTYVFSGHRTDTPAFDNTTYDYQGDSGVNNVAIENGVYIEKNMPGSDAFSVTLSAPEMIQLGDGKYVYYTPGAGTTTDVEIRDTDNVTVLDSFSYSNFIQVSDLLSSAIQSEDITRINALLKPLEIAEKHVLEIQSKNGTKMSRLVEQTRWIDQSNLNMMNTLAEIEDADMAETIVEIQKAETSLLALRESSARVMSQSLLDFLR